MFRINKEQNLSRINYTPLSSFLEIDFVGLILKRKYELYYRSVLHKNNKNLFKIPKLDRDNAKCSQVLNNVCR